MSSHLLLESRVDLLVQDVLGGITVAGNFLSQLTSFRTPNLLKSNFWQPVHSNDGTIVRWKVPSSSTHSSVKAFLVSNVLVGLRIRNVVWRIYLLFKRNLMCGRQCLLLSTNSSSSKLIGESSSNSYAVKSSCEYTQTSLSLKEV